MLAPRSTCTTSRLVPSLLAVTGIVAAAVVAATARTPVAADHEAAAGSVTLVGSLQSELGCPDDWSPPCPATAMTTTPDGSWSITVEVPAGSWAWKVALDGTWDRSYPSADVPLVLQGATRLTFSYDDVSHRVAVAPAEPPEGVTSADRARAGTSLRDDLTRERFYFVMTDRFENADEDNDTGGIPGGRLDHGFDPTHKGFYHGGDLPGLISQLDYIQGLGTTAIWLTPSFKNRPVQGEDPFISAGYHGYWITDFTQVDPHFGTNDDLRGLVDRAHARGMKVFFDIITNHTADVIAYVEGPANNYNYIDKATDSVHPQRHAPTVRRPRLRRRSGLPPARPRDLVPVHTDLPDRGGRDGEGARLAERSDLLPQPRQHRLRRRGRRVRRLLRPRRPLHRAPRRRRGDDRHLRGVGRLRHRRVPDRHRQARQRRVLAGVRQGDRRACRGRGERRLLRLRRGLRPQPGVHVPLHDRGRPASHARLRLPSPGQRLRPGSPDRRTARPVRRRRLLHRHRLQRLLVADVPRQPRHGPHRQASSPTAAPPATSS